MRYFICLSYLGTNYHGWQIQPNALSVQEDLERALSTLLREDVKVTGAGRTDTGVHASRYIAHFDSEKSEKLSHKDFIYHLNAILSWDISVHWIKEVCSDAHARFSATEREYKYYITLSKDPFTQGVECFIPYKVDVTLMSEAANHLLRYKDFTSFAKLHADTNNNLCDVTTAYFEVSEDKIIFTIRANRFLRNMVRAIVGTLLEVGRGKITVDRFCEIIEEENRSRAGSSADSSGLFLTAIDYPQDIYIADPFNGSTT